MASYPGGIQETVNTNISNFREEIIRHTLYPDRQFQGRNQKTFTKHRQTISGKKSKDIYQTQTDNFREDIIRHLPNTDIISGKIL